MLVPLIDAYPVAVFAAAESIPTPGAETSGFTRPSAVGPRLEKEACANPPVAVSAIAPTVSAAAAAPGAPIVHWPGPSLPAATATTRPAAAARFTACDVASVPAEHPATPSERLMTSIP
jgi:hypothetical protein